VVKDNGCGIDDVKLAMQPLFTTDAANERSGMGYSIMESFTDKLTVRSQKDKGTSVTMVKRLNFKKRLSDS
jgi:stage II sporulation protein AB (anti-sigma F factor)